MARWDQAAAEAVNDGYIPWKRRAFNCVWRQGSLVELHDSRPRIPANKRKRYFLLVKKQENAWRTVELTAANRRRIACGLVPHETALELAFVLSAGIALYFDGAEFDTYP